MKTESGRLGRRQIVAIRLDGQVRVLCGSGLLWVTGPSSGDVVLRPGSSTVVSGHGRVVLEALAPARYCLERRNAS